MNSDIINKTWFYFESTAKKASKEMSKRLGKYISYYLNENGYYYLTDRYSQ